VLRRIFGPKRGRENNSKMDRKEVGRGGTDWTDLAQDTERWRPFVNAAIKFRVIQNAGNFFD
jgi:hypothetical protein